MASSPGSSALSASVRAKELYQYQPLDPKYNEIRLLKIHPAQKTIRYGEPVECSLLVTSLDAPPTYQALSYAWGTQPKVEDILLDGRRFKITPNLESALLQLRDDAVDLIWIDALCINQADLHERNEQVSKMRTIYESAEKVLVWLGSRGAFLAFALLEELYQHRHSRESFDNTVKDKRNLKSIVDVQQLFEREYWFRLWVVQEVNSARTITILCGRYKIDWLKVRAVQNMLESNQESLLRALPSSEASEVLADMVLFGGPRSLELPRRDPASNFPSLFKLLRISRRQDISDPRDKIYAIAGLSAARNDPSFVIDYSASVRQVYIDVAKYILLSSRKLDVICSTFRISNEFKLPSWVPNWNSPRGGVPLIEILLASQGNSYNAAGPSKAEYDLKYANQILIVKGFLLSRVKSVGENENLESSADQRAGLLILLSWYRLSTVVKAPISVRVDAFCRTIYWDMFHPEDLQPYSRPLELMEGILGGLAMLAENFFPDQRIDPQLIALKKKHEREERWARRWLTAACARIRIRRLLISDSDLIGMGPHSAEPGDMICILLGCATPVILRPQDGHYIFLGEAYVHGYMYGKGMEELAERKFQFENFEIH